MDYQFQWLLAMQLKAYGILKGVWWDKCYMDFYVNIPTRGFCKEAVHMRKNSH